VSGQERGEAAAGSDRAELPVVARDDQFGPCAGGGSQDGAEVGVVCHAGLGEDDDVAVGEGDLVVVEPPDQRRQGP